MTSAGISSVSHWQRSYAARLRLTDTVIVLAAVFGAQFLRFGLSAEEIEISKDWDFNIGYTLLSLLISASWLLALSAYETRSVKVIGNGVREFRRVVDASLRTFGLLAILGFVFQAQIARGYLLIALPIGVFLLVAGRWGWRRWLVRRRAQGKYLHRAVLIGEREKSVHVARQIQNEKNAGIELVGAVTDHGTKGELLPGVPVIAGWRDGIIQALSSVNADTVVYSGSDSISPEELRQLGWGLESLEIDLIVAPALTDIAGPRIHARPVAGLPLIHVDYPVFTGRKYVAKRTFDLLVSGITLILLSPVLLVLALLVRRDGGPALFRQERIGYRGQPFQMLKFRSMVVNAEDQLLSLLDHSEGNGVLFKMKNDPRITRVGKVLRRYSLDELPQLINVLRGDMSLVGPRPPLPNEVEQYDDRMQRRFLVKPGITGLWQVSGRSDLSWDDSVRLDLYYVENWSLANDFTILGRTVRTMLAPEGAY